MRGLRANRVRTVREGMLIATVDIGATTNTGYCTSVDGRDMKVFKFGNTREGFEKFWHMIVAAQNRFKCTEVVVGYESTGPYAEPLVHYLMDKPARIVQVNPMHTKRLKRGKRQLSRQDGRQGSPGDRRYNQARPGSQYRRS
jgi:transposase